MYSFLRGEMCKAGITITALASQIGVSEKTMRNKISGETPFTWPEALAVRRIVSPSKSKEGMQAALSEYKRTMDVTAAMAAAQHYMEVKRAEEELRKTTPLEDTELFGSEQKQEGEARPETVPTPVSAPIPESYQDGTPVRKGRLLRGFLRSFHRKNPGFTAFFTACKRMEPPDAVLSVYAL